MGTQFCQGCNNICSDGTSLGENNLTQKQNPPITNITNPYFFNNNKTITSINDPKNNNESFIIICLFIIYKYKTYSFLWFISIYGVIISILHIMYYYRFRHIYLKEKPSKPDNKTK